MPVNPQEAAEEEASDSLNYSFLKTARVTASTPGQTAGAHHAFVQESQTESDKPLPVLTQAHGDYYVPTEGSQVVTAPIDKNEFAIVASLVSPGAKPSVDPGERVVSHPNSKASVYFKNDGTLEIWGDTQVVINGGTQGIITDVSAGSRNSNNGITSLDITRDSSIQI